MSDPISSLCRICLEDGATLPIFESTNEENSIYSKICLCVKENVEDIEGYPNHICYECNRMLDSVWNFLMKYKETCITLKKRGVKVKTEGLDNNTENYNDVYESKNLAGVEIEINLKEEPDNFSDEDSQCLADLVEPLHPNLKNMKVKNKSRKTGGCENINLESSINSGKKTSKIAASILEGDFAWTGEKWCFKIGKTQVKLKEKIVHQKIIQKIKPKESKKMKVDEKLCDLCGMVFKTADKLLNHKKTVHFKRTLKCLKCPKTFSSEYYLNNHVKRRHETVKDFKCTVCGKGFAFRGELNTHLKKVHSKKTEPPKVFACKMCDKTYKCAKSVVVHERSVHTGQRPAECTVCGSSFYHIDYLREHMRLHTGETPFKCPVCGRGYAQRGNMKSHLRVHRISELDAATLSKIRPNYLKLLKA